MFENIPQCWVGTPEHPSPRQALPILRQNGLGSHLCLTLASGLGQVLDLSEIHCPFHRLEERLNEIGQHTGQGGCNMCSVSDSKYGCWPLPGTKQVQCEWSLRHLHRISGSKHVHFAWSALRVPQVAPRRRDFYVSSIRTTAAN